jgi:hypothetical protein
VEQLKAIAEWMSEHLGWLCGLGLGVPIGYLLLHGFVVGPRRARRALAALASRGYTPVPRDDAGLLEAVRATLPVYAFERLDDGQRSMASPGFAIVLRLAGRTRYVLTAWRAYRYAAARRTNTQETLLVEVMATGLGEEFEVSPFSPDRVSHGLTPVGPSGGGAASGFTVYAREPEGVRVPERLREALGEVAPRLLEGLAIKMSAGIPRQVVGLRFTPGGWALSCNPFLIDGSELAELVRIADTISAALDDEGRRLRAPRVR